MKTERGMKAGKRNGLTAVVILAIFALAAPQEIFAGTLTVSAPEETRSIHLGIKDSPASARLKGWYCSDKDLREGMPWSLEELQ